MNNKKEYWQWKSTIIDFDTISEEKADFGDYWTKKDMIFHFLGTPDKKIHEWYNGGYSCEYNHALKYAKELGLVEEYIDYEDKLYEKDEEIARLNNIIDELEEYIQLKIIRSENENDYVIDEEDIKELYYKLKELNEEGK